jgi:hypothetical protein
LLRDNLSKYTPLRLSSPVLHHVPQLDRFTTTCAIYRRINAEKLSRVKILLQTSVAGTPVEERLVAKPRRRRRRPKDGTTPSEAEASGVADSAPSAVVNVSGSEGQAYEVNVAEHTCTCGHFVHRGEICKHNTAATTSTEGRAAAPTHAARALAVSCDSGNRRDNPFKAAELQVAGIQHPSAAGPSAARPRRHERRVSARHARRVATRHARRVTTAQPQLSGGRIGKCRLYCQPGTPVRDRRIRVPMARGRRTQSPTV